MWTAILPATQTGLESTQPGSAQPNTIHRNPSRADCEPSPAAAGGYRCTLLDPRPTTHAMLAQTHSVAPAVQNNQSRKPQHPPTRRRRSRRCWAQSNLYCSLLSPNPPGYSESNRPLCPSSTATFCLRHPTLTCWPFDFQQPNQRPKLYSRRRLLRLEGQLPPTTLSPGQSACQPVPFVLLPVPRSPCPPLRGPHLCSAAAWLLRLLGCSAPVPSRWPIVSPPPSHQLCYRGHSHPGSDKHTCPPREPTAVGQACFMFAGVAPMGWRMSPSCFAGPDGHPRDDIIDPDTRCLFRACMPPKATNLCPQLLPRLRGVHGQQITVSPALRDPFRGRMGHATSCLLFLILLLTIIVIRPIPRLSPSSARRRILRRASSM